MRILQHEHSVEVSDFTTRRSSRCLIHESTCRFDAAALWQLASSSCSLVGCLSRRQVRRLNHCTLSGMDARWNGSALNWFAATTSQAQG
jgi:hypothetical protein